jgi:hypothetical protein
VDDGDARDVIAHACPKDATGAGCGPGRGCGKICRFEEDYGGDAEGRLRFDVDEDYPGSRRDGKVRRWRLRDVRPQLVAKYGEDAFERVFVPTLQEYVDNDFLSGHYPAIIAGDAGGRAPLAASVNALVDAAIRLQRDVASRDAEITDLKARLASE